jgi:hypothetical protein
MRFVLKEIKKITESEAGTKKVNKFTVAANPEIFLKLTPNDKEAQIDLRATSIGAFSKEKAGDMFLTVDPSSGKIIQHSGRARSQAAKNSGQQKIEITLRIPDGHQPVSWEQLPNEFIQQDDSQGNPGANRVPKSQFEKIESAQAQDNDPAQIGGNSKTFKDEIVPAMTLPNGYRRPEMVTKEAEKVARFFIKDTFSKYMENVKVKIGAANLDDAIEKSGLSQNEYMEKNISDFQNIFDKNYKISDNKGELTFSLMNERFKGVFWTRQPVGDITITKV